MELNNVDLVEFSFNVLNKEIDITIHSEGKVSTTGRVALCNGDFAFKFLNWCENWLDERELYDVEYKVYIRLH